MTMRVFSETCSCTSVCVNRTVVLCHGVLKSTATSGVGEETQPSQKAEAGVGMLVFDLSIRIKTQRNKFTQSCVGGEVAVGASKAHAEASARCGCCFSLLPYKRHAVVRWPFHAARRQDLSKLSGVARLPSGGNADSVATPSRFRHDYVGFVDRSRCRSVRCFRCSCCSGYRSCRPAVAFGIGHASTRTAAVHVVELGLHRVALHVDHEEEQLIV